MAPAHETEEAAAVAELRELTAGRGDLLAKVAGVLNGTADGEPDEPPKQQAAQLCRKAGADPEAIPAWIKTGPGGIAEFPSGSMQDAGRSPVLLRGL